MDHDDPEPQTQGAAQEPPPGELTAVEERAKAQGIETSTYYRETSGWHLKIELPNGRRKRSVELDRSDALHFGAAEFENYVFIGDYDAIVDKRTGDIQARLSPLNLTSPGSFSMLGFIFRRLPGVEFLKTETETDGESDTGAHKKERDWILDVGGDPVSLQVRPSSNELNALLGILPGFGVSIVLRGREFSTHDTALSLLESVAAPFLFDLDLKYGLLVTLSMNRRGNARVGPGDRSESPPSFPRMAYPSDALSIYSYGRSATRFPLLEFLAYYQTLEYFFPRFSREQAVKRLRTLLSDPRFDPTNELQLSKVVVLAASGSSESRNERQQLRATVRACTDVTELRSFIESEDRINEALLGRKQVIRGVQPLSLKSDSDLRDQVADRMYAIRCRVVHTKQEGDDSGVELLLPSSDEARALRADILLGRYLARQALIATATPLRL